MDDMSSSPLEASPDAHYDFGSFCHFDLPSTSQLTPYELSDSISLQLIDPILQPDCTGITPSDDLSLAGSGLPEALATSHHTYHGSGASTDQPWNPIALTTNSMTTLQPHHQTHYPPPGKIPTDSGYGDSLLSASQHRTPNKASRLSRHRQQTISPLDTRMEQNQILPELSLPMKKSRSTKSHDQDASDMVVQVCPTCSEKFNTKSEYAKHIARHERKFVCEVPNCHRTHGFATRNDLERHQRSVHNIMTADDKVWRCLYGGCKSSSKPWNRLDNFRAHISRMHKDADVDQLVDKSDEWFEKEYKPSQSLPVDQGTVLSDHVSSYSPEGGVPIDNHLDATSIYDNDPIVDEEDFERLRSINPTISVTPTEAFDPSIQHLTPSHNFRIGYEHSHIPSDQSIRMDRVVSSTPMQHNHSTSSYYYPTSGSHSQWRTDDSSLPSSQLLSISHLDYANDIQDFNQSLDVNFLRPPGPRTVPEPISDRQADNIFTDFTETSPIDENGPGLGGQDPLAFSGIGDSLEDVVTEDFTAYAELSQLLSGAGDTQNTILTEETRILPSHDAQRSEKLEQQLSDVIRKFNVEVSSAMLQELTSIIKKESCATSQASIACIATSSNRAVPYSVQSFDSSNDKKDVPKKCSHCPKTFTKKNVLKKHEQRHKKLFFCTFDGCRKKFGTKQDLQRHEMHACQFQKECWRCFDDPTAKGKTISCSELFYDEKEFVKHRKAIHHESRQQKAWDRCHVEKGFAGPFWCGFCDKVVHNPIPGGYDGSPRIKYRYDHIEKHIKKDEKRMTDWSELGGHGNKKPGSRNSTQIDDNFQRDDDDCTSETDGVSPEDQDNTPEILGTPDVSSLLLVTDTKQQSLAPPTATAFGRKRTASMVEGNIDPRSAKCPRLYDRDAGLQEYRQVQPETERHRRVQAERAAANRRNNSPVAYIKCCQCQSDPRWNNSVLTCPICFHRPCRTCQFWKSDFTQLNPSTSGNNG